MLCEPRVRLLTEMEAEPLLSVWVPRVALPLLASSNVTDSLSVFTPPVTLAVKVTDWPLSDGLGVSVNVVVVLFWTNWTVSADWLAALVKSPL